MVKIQSASVGGANRTSGSSFQPRFEVEIGGQVLPSRLDQPDAKKQDTLSSSPESTRVQLEFTQLQNYLHATLTNALFDGESIKNAVTLRQVIHAYQTMHNRLIAIAGEWNALVENVIGFEGRKEGALAPAQVEAQIQSEIDKWRREIHESEGMGGPMIESSLTAKLASQPVDTVKIQLDIDIQERLDACCKSILSQLISLVDLQVLAFIEWYSENTCTYSRFSRNVVVEANDSVFTDRERIPTDLLPRYRRFTKTSGTTSRILRKQIQHLVEATTYALGDSKVVIPRENMEFIRSLPKWLSPHVRIVEGTLIREILVDQDLGIQEWEILHDEVQWHGDPAIVLGPFVLSAWGPSEIQAELAKQEAESKRQAELLAAESRTDIRPMALVRVVGVISTVLAGVFCMARQNSIINPIVGMVLAALAFILLGNRWQHYLPKADEENPAPQDAFGYAGMIVGSVILSSFLLSFGRVVEGISGVLFAILSLKLYCNATYLWNSIADPSDKVT